MQYLLKQIISSSPLISLAAMTEHRLLAVESVLGVIDISLQRCLAAKKVGSDY